MATSFDYTRQAQTYDTTRAASPSVLGPLQEALPPLPGGTLLDLGGGTGNYARALATRGWRAYVLDRSAEMLTRATAKGLVTCRVDVAAVPCPDRSVDAALLVSMLHHVPDWAVALAEARRVVRPGGVVVLMAFTREHLGAHAIEAYFPETMAHFARNHQGRDDLLDALPGARVLPVFYEDLVDGSLAALGRRPELVLDPEIRRQTSFIEWAAEHRPAELEAGLRCLATDLAAGRRPQDEHDDVRQVIGDATVFAWTRPTE